MRHINRFPPYIREVLLVAFLGFFMLSHQAISSEISLDSMYLIVAPVIDGDLSGKFFLGTTPLDHAFEPRRGEFAPEKTLVTVFIYRCCSRVMTG